MGHDPGSVAKTNQTRQPLQAVAPLGGLKLPARIRTIRYGVDPIEPLAELAGNFCFQGSE